MERVRGPQSPYESYCHACGVTFPAEARQCVHCGGRLAHARLTESQESVAEQTWLEGPEALEETGDDEGASPTLRRFGGLLVWIVVALSALISNLCRGGVEPG